MAQIYNTKLTEQLRDAAKIQVNRDVIPNQIADKVVPVVETNPKLLRGTEVIKGLSWNATGGSTTILSGEAGKAFAIKGIFWAMAKDAACDQATASYTLSMTIDGNAYSIPLFETIISTAQNQNGSIDFSTPLVIDQNTNVTTTARAFTAGIFRGRISLLGYWIDNIRA